MRSSTYLLFAAIGAAAARVLSTRADDSHIVYSSDQQGFFIQENPSINSNQPADYGTVNMGLVNRSYPTDATFDPTGVKTQWERFAAYVQSLNNQGTPNVQYKVVYLIRHGEGYHNVAQAYYGTSCWNCYWSQLDGNGTVTWSDAGLTPKGIKQDLAQNNFWANTSPTTKIPLPETFYTSPLTRCLSSANLTFSTLPNFATQPFAPIVKELLRDSITACTCSRRSNETYIHETFPSYTIESGFAEQDPLWTAGVSETVSAETARAKNILDEIFPADANTFISFTTHGGFIPEILSTIGYPNPSFPLATGQFLPALIKAETISGAANPTPVSSPTAAPSCSICQPTAV